MYLENEIIKIGCTELKWQDAFNTLLDEIYYEGYSSTLLRGAPDIYMIEYRYFIDLYDY